MLARAQAQAKCLYIPVLRVIQNNRVHFHFTPARKYRDLLVKDKVAMYNGIKTKLTSLATTQQSFLARRLSWCFTHHYYTAFKLLLK